MSRIIARAGDELKIWADPETGGITQFSLYGEELLAPADPATVEIAVNDRPLKVRSLGAERARQLQGIEGLPDAAALQGKHPGAMVADHHVNQYCGYGLEITRHLRPQPHLNQVHLAYHLSRSRTRPPELVPGPGGPAIEARLHVDTITVPRWNWKFWGKRTHLWHLSMHSSGPIGPGGHVGHSNAPVRQAKEELSNIWRRQYPGVMGVQGGIYYNPDSEHWIAFSCRRPQIGYYLDLEQSGEGLSYSFTLHDEWHCDQAITLPEIVIHYGKTRAEMEEFIYQHLSYHLHDAPAWNGHANWFGAGLWHAYTSWNDLFEKVGRLVDKGAISAVGPYNMIHNWSRAMGGTTPYGYEPDPMMGRRQDFEKGCLALKERGIPLGVWMSHSGMGPGGEIDADWFIRGVDGNYTASWGSERTPALICINPGHPGYIEYTKKWIKYYSELGHRWFFFDCGGWAFPPDYTPRDFMRYPGDTGLMAVKFFDEIVDYAESLDPGVLISLEGSSSDFPIHAPALCHNPVDAVDGMGPRDLVLSLNRPGRRKMIIDQGPYLYPCSGRCSIPYTHPDGLSFDQWFDWLADNKMYQAITAFIRENSIYEAAVLPREMSLLKDRLFVPSSYKAEAFGLPESCGSASKLVDAGSGEAHAKGSDGFSVPGEGMYIIE